MRAVALWALASAAARRRGDARASRRPQLWQRIEREVGLPHAPKTRAPMWIAAAVAAAIVAVAFLFPDLIFKPEVNAVAQLASPQGGEPAFVVSVLDDQEKLLIRAATVAPMPNNSYELWVVPHIGRADLARRGRADRRDRARRRGERAAAAGDRRNARRQPRAGRRFDHRCAHDRDVRRCVGAAAMSHVEQVTASSLQGSRP